jgi:class 3 adenylate cyclase/tetratricopeptide (TPR) repeat protein
MVEPLGERKQATILFADIVGSTEMVAGLDAEASAGRLLPVVAAMAEAVNRFDGTVLRMLGDGLMAAFGVPIAQDGHALLACQAALDMQQSIASLRNSAEIRIGLHSGEVIAGALDTGQSVEPAALGLTVHIASRVEQAANPGEVFLSLECRTLVKSCCDTVSVGFRNLKGLPAPVELFRLIGLTPAVAGDQFRDGQFVRLRGRESELGILHAALTSAEQGHGSAIGIAALPGIGKSRLCYELGELCRQRAIDVLKARGHIFGKSTPLLPILEMMRGYFRVTSDLEPAAARQKIDEKLQTLDPSLVLHVAALADFLGFPAPELRDRASDPRVRHQLLLDLARRMIKSRGRSAGVIIFEDLHWLDEPSHDFVQAMIEAVSGTKLLMVVNYRPPWSSPCQGLPHYREISLTELNKADTTHLVRDLVGHGPALQELTEHVVEKSGGNPFFAEEIIHTLAQRGILAGERGRYQLTSSNWCGSALPATIEAVIGERLDHLPEQDKAVLQVCAVIGKEFPLALVQEVAGLDEQQASELFGRLSDVGLVQACTSDRGPSFSFRHPLIQEVAYSMQLRTRRAKLHSAVAKAIERLPWAQLDETASVLAHHCEAASQPLDAAMHLRRAALWVGRTNPSEAIASWKRIRQLLLDQPRSEASDGLRALASGRVLGYAWSAGLSADDVRPYAEEALLFAREAGDQKHAALILASFGRVFATSGTFDEFVELASQGAALAHETGDADVFAACNGILSQGYYFAGLLREALRENNAATAAVRTQAKSTEGVVFGLTASKMFGYDIAQWRHCIRARILVLLGQFAEAEDALVRALQVDPASITFVVQHNAHAAAIDLAWHRRDFSAARRHAEEVTKYADQSGSPYLRVKALSYCGQAESVGCEPARAAQLLREALNLARQSRMGLECEARLVAHLSDCYHRAGEFDLAIATAAEAIRVARLRADRVAELHGNIVAATALLDSDHAAGRPRAIGHLRRSEYLCNLSGAEIFRQSMQRLEASLMGAEPLRSVN